MSNESPQADQKADPTEPPQSLATVDSSAAIDHAVLVWAESNTRPETFGRAAAVKDKVMAVTSFFEFAGRHPGEVRAQDVARWREQMEGRGLKPATVYARVSRVSAFYRWLISDPRFRRSPPMRRPRRG